MYCPGTVNLKSFRALSVEDFRRDWEVNVLGAVRFLKACQPKLAGVDGNPASVVLFSTVAVGRGMPMHSSVAAAKGAVEGLVRSLAAEWAPKVRVNAIAPALVDTPLVERMLSSPEKREAMAARYPLKRVGTTQDAAGLARFLLGPDSGWITGRGAGPRRRHVDGTGLNGPQSDLPSVGDRLQHPASVVRTPDVGRSPCPAGHADGGAMRTQRAVRRLHLEPVS